LNGTCQKWECPQKKACTPEEIKENYRLSMLKFHPDKDKGRSPPEIWHSIWKCWVIFKGLSRG
jgi:uncharacterized protein (UPF0179 family)